MIILIDGREASINQSIRPIVELSISDIKLTKSSTPSMDYDIKIRNQ